MEPSRGQGPIGFRVIGAFKVACGLLFVAAGFGLLHLLRHDVADGLEDAFSAIRLDPQSHYIQAVISGVSGLSRTRLKEIGFGTFFYAALYLVEGTGLILERRWAGYLTVVATGSLIPLELYEVAMKVTPLRVGALVINVGIVVYLILKLRQEAKADAVAEAPAPGRVEEPVEASPEARRPVGAGRRSRAAASGHTSRRRRRGRRRG